MKSLNENYTSKIPGVLSFKLDGYVNASGGHLYFKLDIILVKGLRLKHTIIMYFPGMKIDPKYVILHVFFLNFQPSSFQNL